MALPQGFVYLEDIDSSIQQDMKYLTDDNFLGRPVKGYKAPRCILTQQAASALSHVQAQLKPQGYGLKVYDCYRPTAAVEDFIAWSEDATDQKMKTAHYPNVDKKDFFELGYVGKKSSHSRGSTADLTIIELDSGEELDMGTIFDFMDPLSHPDNRDISQEAYENRMLLQGLMLDNGFLPLPVEWWHFTLVEEPYPETYFNFEVE